MPRSPSTLVEAPHSPAVLCYFPACYVFMGVILASTLSSPWSLHHAAPFLVLTMPVVISVHPKKGDIVALLTAPAWLAVGILTQGWLSKEAFSSESFFLIPTLKAESEDMGQKRGMGSSFFWGHLGMKHTSWSGV